MRSVRITFALLALLAALAITPVLLADEGHAPVQPPAEPDPSLVPLEQVNTPPEAAFEVAPEAPVARETVTLDASRSSDAEGALALFEWDLDGDGRYESPAGAGAVLQHAFAAPGELDVGLRVTDAGGETAETSQHLTIAVPPEPEPEPAQHDEPRPKPKPRSKPREREAPVAREAASASVAIRDFEFAPKSVTVNVGDTVTWTNNGDEVHTATANNGSFDTGNLDTGESGSYTFREAGTFSYICTPHPFMKGTVTVAGGSAGGSGGSGSATPGESADEAASGGLARTGSDLLPLIGLGLIMLLLGAALRSRVPRSRRT